MGMYTELYLAVELSRSLPKEIVSWCNDSEENENVSNRIRTFGNSGSYYFDAIPHKSFKFDTISNSYFLTTVFNLKNYESEIEELLKVLEPYIISEGHIGHYRYEEDEIPTLLFFEDNKIKKFEVTLKRRNND